MIRFIMVFMKLLRTRNEKKDKWIGLENDPTSGLLIDDLTATFVLNIAFAGGHKEI